MLWALAEVMCVKTLAISALKIIMIIPIIELSSLLYDFVY